MAALGRPGFWLTLVLLVLLGISLVLPLIEKAEPEGLEKTGPLGPAFSLATNTLVGRSQGQKTWEIQVERFAMDKEERQVILSGQVVGTIYRKEEPSYSLVAAGGNYDRRTQDLTLSGPIQISTSAGEFLTATGLYYRHQDDRIELTPPLQIVVGKYTLEADQVSILSNPERVLAVGNVQIKLASNEEICCSQLIYYRETETWEIQGLVELVAPIDQGNGEELSEDAP